LKWIFEVGGPSETTLRNVTIKDPQEEYYVLFGMLPSWWYTVSKENKENVVAGMDDEVGRKSIGGSKKHRGE
jgi:hypothetical protein